MTYQTGLFFSIFKKTGDAPLSREIKWAKREIRNETESETRELLRKGKKMARVSMEFV